MNALEKYEKELNLAHEYEGSVTPLPMSCESVTVEFVQQKTRTPEVQFSRDILVYQA